MSDLAHQAVVYPGFSSIKVATNISNSLDGMLEVVHHRVIPSIKDVHYEAVFISILTCQLPSFFVQNFLRIMFTLSTNNVNFARTTTTLYELCSHFL